MAESVGDSLSGSVSSGESILRLKISETSLRTIGRLIYPFIGKDSDSATIEDVVKVRAAVIFRSTIDASRYPGPVMAAVVALLVDGSMISTDGKIQGMPYIHTYT